MAILHETGLRTTIIVKFKGDVDIMLSPMVLESLQRFIDSIIPTLVTLHPLTILNHLHNECIGKVEDANILKQDQSLSYWSQVQTSSKRSTAERNLKNGQGNEKFQFLSTVFTTFLQSFQSSQSACIIFFNRQNRATNKCL